MATLMFLVALILATIGADSWYKSQSKNDD